MDDNKFARDINNVVTTAQLHLTLTLGEETGQKAFSLFVDILSSTRIYIGRQEDKNLVLKLLPEVFRTLGNSFEIMNDIYNKER